MNSVNNKNYVLKISKIIWQRYPMKNNSEHFTIYLEKYRLLMIKY